MSNMRARIPMAPPTTPPAMAATFEVDVSSEFCDGVGKTSWVDRIVWVWTWPFGLVVRTTVLKTNVEVVEGGPE